MRKRVTMALDDDVLLYLKYSTDVAGSTVPARANALLRYVIAQELARPDVARTFATYRERAERQSAFVPLEAEAK